MSSLGDKLSLVCITSSSLGINIYATTAGIKKYKKKKHDKIVLLGIYYIIIYNIIFI